MARISTEVDSGCFRLRLESPSGLVVNAYLLQVGQAWVLVDTGFAHTTDALVEGLTEVGLGLDDISHVLYTHTHYDHMGGGAALSHLWSPRQFASTRAARDAQDYVAFEARRADPVGWPAGVVADPSRLAAAIEADRQKPRDGIDVGEGGDLSALEGVRFGGEVVIGDQRFRAVDGAGHDPYHLGWIWVERGWLFSGDVILMVPTPFVRHMGDDPLQWLDTLDRWSRLRVTKMFPGHGMPTTLFSASLERSRAAFVRIYDALVGALDGGKPVDLGEVLLRVLPVDRSRYAARTMVWLGTLETVARLLEDRGLVTLTPDGRWQRRAMIPDLATLREEDLF